MASVILKNINKEYPNGYKALKDINLEVHDKEIVVLTGTAGSGKSTILRIIAGLEEITSGELRIGDTLVNDVEAKDRDIAMVLPNYSIYPKMSVYENISLGLKLRNTPKEQMNEMVAEAVEVLHLEPLLGRKVKSLNNEEKYRVALGRAIVRKPKVLIMDEPLLNTDDKLHQRIRTLITELNEKLGTTIIYATHDLKEAVGLGTRIAVMNRGDLEKIGTPRDFL